MSAELRCRVHVTADIGPRHSGAVAARRHTAEGWPLSNLEQCRAQPDSVVADVDPARGGPLLLVEPSVAGRTRLHLVLKGQGFEAICVAAVPEAQAAISAQQFAYAVVNLRLGRGDELKLIERLRQHNAAMRIVVVTDVDSFASVIVALRAGADDYIPQPVGKDELVDALLDRAPVLPPVPDMAPWNRY